MLMFVLINIKPLFQFTDSAEHKSSLAVIFEYNPENLVTFQFVGEIVAFAAGEHLTTGFIVPSTLALLVVVVTVDR